MQPGRVGAPLFILISVLTATVLSAPARATNCDKPPEPCYCGPRHNADQIAVVVREGEGRDAIVRVVETFPAEMRTPLFEIGETIPQGEVDSWFTPRMMVVGWRVGSARKLTFLQIGEDGRIPGQQFCEAGLDEAELADLYLGSYARCEKRMRERFDIPHWECEGPYDCSGGAATTAAGLALFVGWALSRRARNHSRRVM